MKETNIERLANKLQLLWFVMDAVNDGEEISPSILDKANKSLNDIKQLLVKIEEEHYGCDDRAVSFGRFLLEDLDGGLTEKLFQKWVVEREPKQLKINETLTTNKE